MYSYIKGTIVEIGFDYIVLDNQGIGYKIYVSNPYEFKQNQERMVYVYQQVKEDDLLLYGFKDRDYKNMFLKLITVKGIGCKTAIGMLAAGDIDAIIGAINNDNVAYLKKIPGIGPKAAKQIILDLQGKFKDTPIVGTKPRNSQLEEASEVLIALGYRPGDVDKVISKLVNEELDTNGYVKKALSLLVK